MSNSLIPMVVFELDPRYGCNGAKIFKVFRSSDFISNQLMKISSLACRQENRYFRVTFPIFGGLQWKQQSMSRSALEFESAKYVINSQVPEIFLFVLTCFVLQQFSELLPPSTKFCLPLFFSVYKKNGCFDLPLLLGD